MRRTYLDYAATTPMHPDVFKAMRPFLLGAFGNPSSMHSAGQEARVAIEEAREKVASLVGATAEEIVFTSGGTEADNLALKGTAYAGGGAGNHIITSSVEHHAVLETGRFLERLGFAVTYLPVDGFGLVDPAEVKKSITPRTVLVSVMHANNEVGTVEPIVEIGRIARESGIAFHTDAVQTAGHVPAKVDDLGVDLLAMSAHKLGGPKGVGALYVRKGTRIVSFMHGGEQERGRRASTENVPGIVGFGQAAAIAQREQDGQATRLASMRDRLARGLLERIDHVRLNGHPTQRLPNNVHVTVDGVEGEHMLLNLDARGICVSTASACSASSSQPSHVLLAMGLSREQARGSIRLTLGRETVERDIDRVLTVVPEVVARLRAAPSSAEAAAGHPLRKAILEYEAQTHLQMLCRYSHMVCLTCPFSGMGRGCTLAKWQLARRRGGAWR